MNLIIKRRQLILATLVVALGAAVFVNWYYTGNNKTLSTEETTKEEYVRNLGEAEYVNADAGSSDYFKKIRLQRQKNQDEATDNLKDSLKNVGAGTQEAKEITAAISELSERIKLQGDVETLISAKVSGDCVVIINDTTVQVVVEKGVLNEDTALQIMDIVTKNTGFDPSAVTVAEGE